MGWIDDEPRLPAAGWTATKRLLRRARSSWPVWVAAALLVGAVATVMRSRVPIFYSTSVVLRVTEGQSEIPGSLLGEGALRAHLNEQVFTTAQIKELMKRHPGHFGDPESDPAGAMETFGSLFNIDITENDFTEERGAMDPPRSARLQIKFHSLDPEFAFKVARELGDLVIGSTVGRQKEMLERQQAAALAAATEADKQFLEAARSDPMLYDIRTRAARDRAALTKQRLEGAMLALRALGEKQALRFEVVDPGEVAVRVRKSSLLLSTFLWALFSSLLGGVLLAGAFDPRVLDAKDLEVLGVPPLGRFPALPARR
jgi:hypothetical protein